MYRVAQSHPVIQMFRVKMHVAKTDWIILYWAEIGNVRQAVSPIAH